MSKSVDSENKIDKKVNNRIDKKTGMNNQIEENLKKLPDLPGVYLHKDRLGQVIYVGKAISLKNRVRQYFQKSSHTCLQQNDAEKTVRGQNRKAVCAFSSFAGQRRAVRFF